MLIANAELLDGRRASVRIERRTITAIGSITPQPGEPTFDANGALLIPGLHDHHIHVAATAAALASVRCGPPDVTDEAGLAAALSYPGQGWLRGIGYHESVAGLLSATQLDRIAPDRPVRIQHRSGRMWFFNGVAIDLLLAENAPPPGLDRATGQLFEGDAWLKQALASTPPAFDTVGRMLAARGVTGLTEISPGNDAFMAQHFSDERASGRLPQRVLLAGRNDLRDAPANLSLGPAKLHLHEADLPSYDDALSFIHMAHAQGRAVAVHCATEVELVFTLAAFAEAGVWPGDRIEHASIAPDSAVAEIARLGLAVVSQPHFIAERGDVYARDVAPRDRDILYRLRAFFDAGVPLAGGSDAPFGGTDPWAAMAAAVSRQTLAGLVLGPSEALSPEQALALYLADPIDLERQRTIAIGAPADLCLLDSPWAQARENLASVGVRKVWIDGIDQAPGERDLGGDAAA